MFRRPFNWQEIERLQREMNRLFESSLPHVRRPLAPGFPAMNVWTNDDGAIVTAELPGVEPENIDISLSVDELTVSGSRSPGTSIEDTTYHRQERRFGEFSRTIQLPFSVNKGEVDADLRNGILRISLPRAEEEKPRQIAVKKA